MRRRAWIVLVAVGLAGPLGCGGDAEWYNYLFPITLLFKSGDCPAVGGGAHAFTVEQDVTVGPEGEEPLVGDLYVPAGDGPFTAVIFAGKASAHDPADYARGGAVVLDLGYAEPAPAEVVARAADWLLGREADLHLAPGCVGEAG